MPGCSVLSGHHAHTYHPGWRAFSSPGLALPPRPNLPFARWQEALPNAASVKQPADLATVLAVQRALCSGEDMRTSVARTLKELHLPADTLSPAAIDALEPQAAPALAPVCAILGGLIGQEVIKVISAKDTPIDNFLVLDSVSPPPNSGARVIRLAPPPK